MKKILLLLTCAAFFVSTSFAKIAGIKLVQNETEISAAKDAIGTETLKLLPEILKGKSCSVSGSWQNANGSTTTMTITVNCSDCTTTQQACDQAYQILSLAIPN